MSIRRSILIVVIALGSVVAGYVILIPESPQARAPDDPAQSIIFTCARCGHAFAMSPKALGTGPESRQPTSGRWLGAESLTVRCPKCGKLAARRSRGR